MSTQNVITPMMEVGVLTAIEAATGKKASKALKEAMNWTLEQTDENIVTDLNKMHLYRKTSYKMNLQKRKISVRLNEDLLKAYQHKIGRLIEITSYDQLFLCGCLTYLEKKKNNNQSNLGKELKTFNIIGSKWDKKMVDAISNILDTSNLSNITTSAEPCAGCLGIHANHQISGASEIINDNDIEKVNFFKCVKQDASRVMIKCLSFDTDKDSYKKILNRYQKRNLNSKATKAEHYDHASEFYYLNQYSNRNDPGSYDTSKTSNAYYGNCYKIVNLGRRLQNTKITNRDLMNMVNDERLNTPNTLLFVDPPYLDCDYYNKENKFDDIKSHSNLARRLGLYKGKFIYFCRVTAVQKEKKKDPRADEKMEKMIDYLYGNCGLYYVDVPLKTNVIERIITNFPFDRSTKYIC